MLQKLLHQTDFRLGKWYNSYGCLLRTLQSFAETSTRPLSSQEIIKFFDKAVIEKWVAPRDQNDDGKIDEKEANDFFVEKPNEIVAYGWSLLKVSGKAPRQIGGADTKGVVTWGTKEGARFTVLKWKTKFGFHFTRGDSSAIEDWDAYPGLEKLSLVRIDYYK